MESPTRCLIRLSPWIIVLFLLGCGGGGGGGGGGNGGGGPGTGTASEPADRFVISGNADGTLSILRADPVAGFAHAIAYFRVSGSGFSFQDIIHDAANGRLVALTSNDLHVLTFDATTGEISETAALATSGSSTHLALNDDGSMAYVASGTGPNVFLDVFPIGANGILSPRTSTELGINPDYVTLNPAGDRLYVVSRSDDQIVVFNVNANGSLAAGPATIGTDQNPTALIFNEAGTVAYLTRANNDQNSLQIYDVDEDGGLDLRADAYNVDTSAIDLVLSADGGHLYVIQSSNPLHHFSVEEATGDLTFIETFNLGFSATDLTLSHTGAELYVSHSGGDVVSTLAVDPSDGTLTVMDFARVFTGANTVAAIGGNGALVPTATYLLAPDRTGLSIFDVGAGGVLALVDKLDAAHALINGEVAVHYPAGLLLGAGTQAGGDDLLTSYHYDLVDGDLEFIESFIATNTASANFSRMELGRSGEFLYVLGERGTSDPGFVRAYAFNTDGEITEAEVAQVAIQNGAENLTLHPAGRYLYAINSTSDTISRFQINPATGGLSGVGLNTNMAPGSPRPIDLKFHPNGRYAYVSLEDDSEMIRFTVGTNGSLDDPQRANPPANDGIAAEPGPIGVHPNGQYLYVGERDPSPNSIAIYDINQNNFSLAYRTRIAAAANPTWIEVDPLGRFLYVRFRVTGPDDESVQVFAIDDSTGALTPVQFIEAGRDAGFMPSMTLVTPLLVQ